MAKLTAKQQVFCDEYLISLNATQAAIKAGYSERSARVIGLENLTKPALKKYIDERMNEEREKRIASREEILQYLTGVVRGEERGTTLVGVGMGAQEVTQEKPTISERTKAAELLGKRYGLFVDKQQIEHSGSVVFTDDID